MVHSLFVISDLHLGGAPARNGKPSFQMCSPETRKLLAEFITYVSTQRNVDRDVHLVINGDIVDFLAEEEFASFTNDDDLAKDKLQGIISSTQIVWDHLRDFVGSGGRLTLPLGNHDPELSLLAPKTLLMKTLGPGRVELISDNQAFVEGPVLIEHGNRYDAWNVLSHGALRAIRSALSRREKPIAYIGPPGSQLVERTLNPLKARYPFVDLLKPEGPGVLPIVAVLDPSSIKEVPKLVALAAKSSSVQFDQDGIPMDPRNIRAPVYHSDRDRKSIKLAYELAGFDPANISIWKPAKDLLQRIEAGVTALGKKAAREVETNLLLKAFQSFAESHKQAFDVNAEDDEYLKPARVAVSRRFEIVMYGHTHLAERVKLTTGACYFNTGTWADLMKVPDAILCNDIAQAQRQLDEFLSNLERGELDRWRCLVPTFARVDMDSGRVISADLYLFDGAHNISRLPDGRLPRVDRL